MNVVVVWLPSIVAATLLCVAAVVMQSPASPDPARPAAPSAVAEIEYAEPTEEELRPDAAELQAVRDVDGTELLAVMEVQVKDGRRLLSAMKNSPPTRGMLKGISNKKRRVEREIRELQAMGSDHVDDAVFRRAEEIVQELRGAEKEAAQLLAARPPRNGLRGGPPAAPEPPAPAQAPAPIPDEYGPAGYDDYGPAQVDYPGYPGY